MFSRSYRLGKYSFILEVAPKNTVWHFTHVKADSPLQRQDHLFSVCRVWIRTYRKYVWEIRLGRIQLLMANREQ